MNLRKKLGCALSVIGISLPGSAMADLYVYGFSGGNSSNGLNITTSSGDFFVSVTDSGWWTNSFGHDASNKNYFAGHSTSAFDTGNHNSYFTFDLSGITVP